MLPPHRPLYVTVGSLPKVEPINVLFVQTCRFTTCSISEGGPPVRALAEYSFSGAPTKCIWVRVCSDDRRLAYVYYSIHLFA